MKEEIIISLINRRGRIVWTSPRDMQDLIANKGMRLFPNPKRDYYPEYDETASPANAHLNYENLEGNSLDVDVL